MVLLTAEQPWGLPSRDRPWTLRWGCLVCAVPVQSTCVASWRWPVAGVQRWVPPEAPGDGRQRQSQAGAAWPWLSPSGMALGMLSCCMWELARPFHLAGCLGGDVAGGGTRRFGVRRREPRQGCLNEGRALGGGHPPAPLPAAPCPGESDANLLGDEAAARVVGPSRPPQSPSPTGSPPRP